MSRLILIVLIIFVYSCKSDKDLRKITEGTIVYDISYHSDIASSVPVQFLPKTMVLSFNKEFASYKIEDMMGVFCITNTTDLSERTHISTIKIFNKKYKYEGTDNEVPVFFQPQTTYAIENKEDSVSLAGISCNKSIVTNIKEHRNFEVLHSDLFFIKNPNINTPYSEIDGVLMKFEIDLDKMRLTLTAKKIIPSAINNKEFKITNDYKPISQEKMRSIIATMLK